MTRSLIILVLILSVFSLPGCKTIYSDHLIGEQIAAGEAEELEGIWQFGDSAMHVKHVGGGEFVAAFLEWEDEGFEMREMDLVITELGDTRFLQAIIDEDEDDEDEGDEDADEGDDEDEADDEDQPWIICGLLTGTDGRAVVLSAPEFDRFVEAIEAGAIEGEVDDDDNEMHIHGEKEALDTIMSGKILHELFNMKEPMVITRMGDL